MSRRKYSEQEKRQICKEYAQAAHGTKQQVLKKYRVYAATVSTWARRFQPEKKLRAARERYERAVVSTPEPPVSAPGVSVEQLIRVLADLDVEETLTDRILGRVTKLLHG